MIKPNIMPQDNHSEIKLKNMLKGNLRQYVMFIALVAVILFF
jgi:hypothetical protein